MERKISGRIICLDIKGCKNNKAPFILADASHLPFVSGSFDSTTLFYVLHHAACPQDLLLEVCRVSRSRVVIHEDVYTNLFEKLMYQIHIWSFKKIHNLSGTKAMTDVEWLKLFDQVNMRVEKQLYIKRIGYPVSRREFILATDE